MPKTPLIALAALFFGAALLLVRQNAMRGFPDGHVTSFARCMDPAFSLLPPAMGVSALAFLLAAFWPRHRRAASRLAPLPALAALGHLGVLAFFACWGLENGWGG